MSFNLDSLFIEWRAKVPTGIPNIKNAYHLVLLKEICLNKGIDSKIVDDVILVLERKVDDDETIKYKQDGENKEMKASSAKTMEKDHPAKIEYDKLVDDEDTEKPEKDPTSVAGQQLQSDPEKGGTYMKKKDDVEDVDAEDGGEESKQNISDENQKIVSDFESRVDKQKSDLGEKKSQIVNDSLDKIKTI